MSQSSSESSSKKQTLLESATRRTLTEEVADRLRAAIWSGDLAPGEKLNERELAEQTEVSRGPVREAIGQLQHEGLVMKETNRSTIVAQLSREDLDEVYSLRLVLERLAVKQVVCNAEEIHF